MKDALVVANNILKVITLYRGLYRSQTKISGLIEKWYVVSQIFRPSSQKTSPGAGRFKLYSFEWLTLNFSMKYQFIVEKTEQELRQLLREPNVTYKKNAWS